MKNSNEFSRQWLRKARNDLLSAKQILQLQQGPTDTVCFHAQQTVEKSLKALLTFNEITFPKIHNLIRLLELVLPHFKELETYREQFALLSNYAVEMRYPGEWIDPDRKEAHEAVNVAGQVLDLIENKMGKI